MPFCSTPNFEVKVTTASAGQLNDGITKIVSDEQDRQVNRKPQDERSEPGDSRRPMKLVERRHATPFLPIHKIS